LASVWPRSSRKNCNQSKPTWENSSAKTHKPGTKKRHRVDWLSGNDLDPIWCKYRIGSDHRHVVHLGCGKLTSSLGQPQQCTGIQDHSLLQYERKIMRGQVVSVDSIAGVLLCGGLLLCALWSPAQGNPPSTPSKGHDAPLLTPAAIDERLTAVEERLAHVRAQLALLPTAAVDTTPPAGATAEEWSEHKELLHRLGSFYQGHLDALRELREIRQFQADLQEEASRWQGFTTPPPYALDVVEALWNTLRAKDREIEVARAEIAMFERLREAARPALMQSQQALVGVAYGSSTQHVLDLLKQAVEDHPRTLGDPTPEVLLTDFGDNAILFRVDYWIDISLEPNWRRVASEIRQHVEKLFTEYGIMIAFPQQDVHLDSPMPLKVEVVTHTAADGAGQAVQPA
jgi:Mechanosensitive ion channel